MLRLILRAIEQRRWPVYLFLALYTPLVIFPHERVQQFLGDWLVKPFGYQTFYCIMAALGTMGIVIGSWLMWRAVRTHPWCAALTRYGLLTLGLVLFAWRILSVNNSELVHFIQYAVPGFLIFGLTRSVSHTLAWTILIGGLDEGYQYAGLHGGWGVPFDFNDIYLDLLGGAIGVQLALAHTDPLPSRNLRSILLQPGVALLLVIVAGTGVLLLTGHALQYEDKANLNYWFALSRLKLPGFWFFDETWGPRTIHTLTPLEGPILILATLFVYARLDQRR